ncbi:hypothetical protein [Stenotrophomonas maltophilia]|uniref:hypothetical protein n=1 Tax=Stenotrophomonas maltophilia TaxID=40324 RepID=UPI003BF7D7DD
MDLHKKINWATVFVYVALIAIGFAAALGMLGLTGQIVFGKDAPAWVQAIGSIVAILIAVAVPATQHYLSDRKQRQEAQDKARSLGLLLLPHIASFAELNNNVWLHEHPDDNVEDIRDNACIAGYITRSALEVPEEISDRIDELHVLGPAAEGVQRAVFNVISAGELVVFEDVPRENAFGSMSDHREPVIQDKTKFYDLLWDALGGLTISQVKIEEMFPHAKRAPLSRTE